MEDVFNGMLEQPLHAYLSCQLSHNPFIEVFHYAQLITGLVLGRKPLFVAIAQRKEERQVLQVIYAQRMEGYSHLYYPTPGVVPQPSLMYQQPSIRPVWRAIGIPNPSRPLLRPSPLTLISLLGSQQFEAKTRRKDEGEYSTTTCWSYISITNSHRGFI